MRALVLSSVLLTAACAVGPDYKQPSIATDSSWKTDERVDSRPADLTHWWQTFNDPALDSLIERAVAANHDLRIATSRVREARAAAGFARGQLAPEVNASATYERGRWSENGQFSSNGDVDDLHTAGFDAVWELDVFGGKRRGVEAAQAELDATVEERNAVLVTVLGEVARTYIDLRGQQRLAAVQRQNVESARETLSLTRTRFDAKMATSLDVARSEALLASTESLVPQAERAVEEAIHRLGILRGREPSALAAELASESEIPSPPSRISTGSSSDLLARRPDVRRAERQLAAATARVGVATAELYPKFSLFGELGLESVDLSDFTSSSSRMWNAGLSAQWSLFNGGRVRSLIEISDAQMEQARVQYEQAFLLALQEVENALTAYGREWERLRSLEAAARASATSVELADELHRKGLVSFLDVLEAQRELYDAQRELVQSEAAVSIHAVALYKSLGGGWEERVTSVTARS